MDSVTLPEKLSMLVSDTVDVAMLPWRIVRKLGFSERVKSGPMTFSWMYAEWLRLLGPMPVKLTDANPGVVVDGTVTVRVVLACPPEVRLMLLLVRVAVIVP